MPVDLGGGVTLLLRADTGVRYAGRSRMRFPLRKAIGHHSVTAGREGSQAAAVQEAREIDGIGTARGLGAFPYSYGLPRVPGLIIEGQGDYIGAHTAGHNSDGLGVVLFGNYQDVHHVEDYQVHAWYQLRAWLIGTGRLVPNVIYPTWDHQATGYPTACWGARARARMGDFQAGGAPPPVPVLSRKGLRMYAVHLVNAPEVGYPQGALFTGYPGAWMAVGLAEYAQALREGAHQVTVNGRQWDLWCKQLHPDTLRPIAPRPAA